METSNATLAELAVTHPAASRVFQANRLDYCCNGRRSLREACAQRGLDPEAILAAIRSQSASSPAPERWDERSTAELLAHIVDHYHARLRREIPELISMAEKVEKRHAGNAACPRGLSDHLRAVHENVLDHLDKEEQILFPILRGGYFDHAGGPILCMEREHDDHARDLERTRELTAELSAPAEACETWRALYLRLAELESELMEHVHLENHVLFPRARTR